MLAFAKREIAALVVGVGITGGIPEILLPGLSSKLTAGDHKPIHLLDPTNGAHDPLGVDLRPAQGTSVLSRFAANPRFAALEPAEQCKMAAAYRAECARITTFMDGREKAIDRLLNTKLSPSETARLELEQSLISTARSDFKQLKVLFEFMDDLQTLSPNRAVHVTLFKVFAENCRQSRETDRFGLHASSWRTLVELSKVTDREGMKPSDRLLNLLVFHGPRPEEAHALVTGVLMLVETKGLYSNQGDRGTCAARAVQNYLLVRDPAEFVLLVTKVYRNGAAEMRDGRLLRYDQSWQGPPPTRKLPYTSFVFQSAALRVFNPKYEPSTNKNAGLNRYHLADLMTSISGIDHSFAGQSKSLRLLRENPDIVRVIGWKGVRGTGGEGHAQYVAKVTTEGVILQDSDYYVASIQSGDHSFGTALKGQPGLLLVKWEELEASSFSTIIEEKRDVTDWIMSNHFDRLFKLSLLVSAVMLATLAKRYLNPRKESKPEPRKE